MFAGANVSGGCNDKVSLANVCIGSSWQIGTVCYNNNNSAFIHSNGADLYSMRCERIQWHLCHTNKEKRGHLLHICTHTHRICIMYRIKHHILLLAIFGEAMPHIVYVILSMLLTRFYFVTAEKKIPQLNPNGIIFGLQQNRDILNWGHLHYIHLFHSCDSGRRCMALLYVSYILKRNHKMCGKIHIFPYKNTRLDQAPKCT